jgi:hypothetical protein
VLTTPVLAEVLYEHTRPELVVGCFSTALLTAASFYGLRVARTGTELLLERIAPYQNSNRVPVTLVDAILPDADELTPESDPDWELPAAPEIRSRLTGLLRSVGFAMQPEIYPELREEARKFLAAQPDVRRRRYFKRRRLTALALPGGVPQQFAYLRRRPTVRRAARRVRQLKRAALG